MDALNSAVPVEPGSADGSLRPAPVARTCSDCSSTIGKHSKSGRCKACAMRVMHADPAYAARRDAATREMNRRPEIKAKRRAA